MSKTTQKDSLDRFYTRESVAHDCVGSIRELLYTFNTIIEPSAGGGSFLNALQNFNSVEAYDLAPSAAGIVKRDWFDVNLRGKGSVCVIGNPPFGKRNSLSKAFIEHAISFDNVKCVAMILPNSWNKPSLQNRTFPTAWKLVQCTKLDTNSFTFEGSDYKVPCSFQVWVKGGDQEDLRWPLKPAVEHQDFIFTTEHQADFFVMGASPKVIKEIHAVDKNNRGYYIKSLIGTENLKHRLLDIKWDSLGNATAGGGVYWISKPEFVKAYTDYIKELL